MKWTIGIDEVGRGPLAGPVTVCVFAQRSSVSLIELFPGSILKDSKQLSRNNRVQVRDVLMRLREEGMVDFEILHRSAQDIDERGIAVCIREMMHEGLENLTSRNKDISTATQIFLDGGLRVHDMYTQAVTVIRGDAQIVEIACASIIAKEERDDIMRAYSKRYPEYGFESHMGYATKAHRDAILQHGKIHIHRNSFIHFI